ANGVEACIDPLAEGIDLEPFLAIMRDEKILKVFHAARQDVEIFNNLQAMPKPLFDTQVAGMAAGFGEQIAYDALVRQMLRIDLDKSSRFTDWSNRPLTERQIEYALGDVSHLRTVYVKLRDQLAASNRAEWVQEEIGVLTSPETYRADPHEVWRRFKWRAEKPRLRAYLQGLAEWRELEAQRLNVPRGRVLRDEALAEIANHPPDNAHELARVRGLSTGFAESRQGAEVLAVVAKARALPLDQCPAPDKRRVNASGLGPAVDLLKILLKQVSEEHGVASKLIATVDDLEEIAADDNAETQVLKGWRRELFGNAALALKRGELALSVRDKKVVTLPT
ncbi:MAG: ribonuclease D, partial [Pseudomonadota bacterium]|nr:ribonuclease D [Pseudomonadota bacterium]